MEIWWTLAVFLLFGGTMVGIFLTKTRGFGRYTTSIVLLVLVLFVAAIAFILGKLELHPLANLLFAVAGYAGGLLTGRDPTVPGTGTRATTSTPPTTTVG
jgi:p-aminobenzoyl-glutamate transporter AbgT